MHLHEYQIKSLMQKYKVNTTDGVIVSAKEEIPSAIKTRFGLTDAIVVKAQVHAGGRGKGGGVKFFPKSKESEAIEFATKLLGTRLVTPQTDANGQFVSSLYLADGCDIEKELYLSLLVNREKNCVSMIVSDQGGMDIEEVAHNTPDKIHTIDIDPISGYQPFYTKLVSKIFGIEDRTKELNVMLTNLYKLFVAEDLSLLEINPLILGDYKGTKQLIALDGKATIDSNALFKHADLKAMWDETQETPIEVRAKKAGLSYIQLEGNIGCMVNGAGLAMATMDNIKYFGASPANFLDVGGGASKEGVKTALNIILSDENVKGVLINIFGGIVRCDMIAEAVVASVNELKKENVCIPPIVVRLAGTNFDEGSRIISDSGLGMIPASDLDDATKKIVAAIQ